MDDEQAPTADKNGEGRDLEEPPSAPEDGGRVEPESEDLHGSAPHEGATSAEPEDPGRHSSAPEEGAPGGPATPPQPQPPSGAAPNWDRVVIIAQLLAGVALVVFGALLAALTKEATHDIGTAVIGVGAALIPAGAAASASARIAKTNSGG